MVVVLVVIGAAVALIAATKPYPDAWDPRVEPFAAFVEQERGLQFEHPVYVDFIPDAEFDALLTDDEGIDGEEAAARQEAYEQYGELLRALGLHEGPIDLEAQTDQMYSAGVLAYYSSDDKRVRVKGEQLTPDVEVTLVHELTHALQDQHFDLDVLDTAETTSASDAFRTVVEGDAVWVEDAYVASLSDAEQDEIDDAESEGIEEATEASEGVNDALIASFGAPYILGPAYQSLLHAQGGYDEVDRALRTPPPDEGAIFDPADQLLGAEREVLPPPDLPDGADELSEQERLANTDSLGALTLFLMLAARIDAHEAMAATDLVAGDQLLVFTRDGATCAAIDLATASDADADDLEDTMQAWADAMPEEADASVEREASVVAIESCDPSPVTEMGITAKGSESIFLPTTRLYVAAQAIQLGATDDEALCAAKTTTDALTVEQLADPDLDLSVFQQAQRDGLRACVR